MGIVILRTETSETFTAVVTYREYRGTGRALRHEGPEAALAVALRDLANELEKAGAK